MEERELTWRRSSRSGTDNGGGNCLEQAASREHVLIRDSKLSEASPILRVGRADWRAFLTSLR